MIIPSNEFIEKFRNVKGAMSVCEMIFLYNCAFDSPQGECLELGSHRGKSSMAIAAALNKESSLYLVEPEFEDKEWVREVMELVRGYAKNVFYVAGYSTDVIQEFHDLAFVFVDSGSHQDGLPMREVKMLEDRVKSGGIIAFHDLNSQFIEVGWAYSYLVNTGKYDVINPDWGKIESHVSANDLEKGNDTWHHTELDHPKFIGALRRK
jgi:hypothetical protein